jgi:hypothetical protein
MAEIQKPKFKSKLTPMGEARWAYLHKPNTKFNDMGVYQTELILDLEDDHTVGFTSELQEMLDATREWAEQELERCMREKPKLRKTLAPLQEYKPFEEELDDEGEETGTLKVRFKKAASYKDKKTDRIIETKINLFDAKGKLIKKKIAVGNGSKIVVEYYPTPFLQITNNIPTYGLSLKLNKAQIVVLEAFGDDSTSSFAKVEDGFDASEYEGGCDESEGFVEAPEAPEDADF